MYMIVTLLVTYLLGRVPLPCQPATLRPGGRLNASELDLDGLEITEATIIQRFQIPHLRIQTCQ